MLTQTVKYVADNWGDLASMLGLLVALVGFAVTIYKTTKAKTAAEAAQNSADEVKRKLFVFDTISYITEAISIMNEIKRLQRAGAWPILPDRYAALRKLLILIRDADAGLESGQKSDITNIIQHLSINEHRIEKSIHTSLQAPSVSNLNQKMSEFIDRLTEVQAEIRARFGECENG